MCVCVRVLYSLPSVLVCISFRLPIYFFCLLCSSTLHTYDTLLRRRRRFLFIYIERDRMMRIVGTRRSVGLVFFRVFLFFAFSVVVFFSFIFFIAIALSVHAAAFV